MAVYDCEEYSFLTMSVDFGIRSDEFLNFLNEECRGVRSIVDIKDIMEIVLLRVKLWLVLQNVFSVLFFKPIPNHHIMVVREINRELSDRRIFRLHIKNNRRAIGNILDRESCDWES